MTTIFDGTPTYTGINGDRARVTSNDGRVLVRAIDAMAEEAVAIALTPIQAAKLADAIMSSVVKAKGHPNA